MRAHLHRIAYGFQPLCLLLPAVLCLAASACWAQSPPGGPTEPQPPQQQEGQQPMQPKIVDREAFRVLGTITPVKRRGEDPQTYVTIWNEFESFRDQVTTRSTDGMFYGIQFASDGDDTIDYMAGMAVGEVADVAEPLVVRSVPAARYAVFECPTEQIGPAYRYIFSTWLPDSKHKLSDKAPVFEQYPPVDDLQSPVLIHVPIQ